MEAAGMKNVDPTPETAEWLGTIHADVRPALARMKKPAGRRALNGAMKSMQRVYKTAEPQSAIGLPLRSARGVESVTVTPEIAQHWLTFNVANRELVQSKVDQFHADMESGNWLDDGSTIRFAYGKLLDGQHRLMALMLAGVSLPMLVVYGLDSECQVTMDTGRGRTPRDSLSIEGLDKWGSATMGSALHIIMAHESGLALYSPRKYTNREVRDYYLENRSALEKTVQFCKALPHRHPLLPHARTMAIHYVLSKIDIEGTEAFLTAVLVGTNLVKGSPVFYLRERLDNDLKDKRHRNAYEQFMFVVKAWNTLRAGRQVKSGNYLYHREGDAFPEIAG
jgi:hypothetical protein